MTSNFRLMARTGPVAGNVYPLEAQEIYIGRDLNNDIVINDPEVSRRHARLFVQGSSYVIEDLGSTNGSMVNGQRIVGPYNLNSGEEITFGEKIHLVFESTQPVSGEATVVSSGLGGDATVASSSAPDWTPEASPSPYLSASPEPYSPSPSYSMPEQAESPAYAGQVPNQPQGVSLDDKKKFPTVVIVIVIILVVICICVGALIAIDQFGGEQMWCNLFGFLFNAIWPGTCP